MIGFVLPRVAGLAVTLLLAALLIYVVLDPAAAAADAPVWQRFFGWIGGALLGDFGSSAGGPLGAVIAERLAVTVPLALLALLLAAAAGLPLGLLAGSRPGPVADAAVAALARRPVPPMRVGLLATRGTLAAAFYGERLARHGFDWIVPTDEEQDRFVAEAIARVKAGDTAGARAPFEAAVRGLADRGADLVLLACTELPIAAEGSSCPVPLLDASRALAGALVAFSLRR